MPFEHSQKQNKKNTLRTVKQVIKISRRMSYPYIERFMPIWMFVGKVFYTQLSIVVYFIVEFKQGTK